MSLSAQSMATLGLEVAVRTKGQRGIGFLLHCRWQSSFFKPISERCAVLGVRVTKKCRLRVAGAYMPHAGQPDEDVDSLYTVLDAEHNEAKSKGDKMIITGDFNAEVGTKCERDSSQVIGENPMNHRSERGELLLQWCTLHGFALSNTYGCTSIEAAWTYRNGELRKQLDYFLVESALQLHTVACLVLPGVDIGSDHRPILLDLDCGVCKRKHRKKRRPKHWRPDAVYVETVRDRLAQSAARDDATSKAALIEEVLAQAVPVSEPPASASTPSRSAHDSAIHTLIEQRRSLASNTALSPADKKSQRIELGKAIQKVMRKKLAEEKTLKIIRVLAEFRDLQQLDAITGRKKKASIVEITDSSGVARRSKGEIAEVFAQFYEQLYKSRHSATTSDQTAPESPQCIPPFTSAELGAALRKMKTGKASDSSGIAAEMLKIDCPILQEMVLDLFNEVLTSRVIPPTWRTSRLIVLFKKGDPKLPANYRPIAILPVLYKLFSRMLCARLEDTIIGQQSVDQAAYRKGFGTDDHLLCLTLLLEQSAEWNTELWLGLVDFEKAFDTVEHPPLWAALKELGVTPAYIDILQLLYNRQEATVAAGQMSRPFPIERGVKQGDPISPLLFLAVMEVIFRRLKSRWNKLNLRRQGRYYGVVVDKETDPLTNLRFADDVLLFASSPSDAAKMISDLNRESSKFGLKLHMGKTAVLTNRETNCPTTVSCRGQSLKVVSKDETERYLGRKLSMIAFHGTEFANRLAAGWAAFFKLKEVFCNRKVPLRDRLRLFECSVTPCALYACGAWTTTSDMECKLRTTRRRMLRWMVGVPRHPEEAWVDYVQRATHRSEALASTHGATDWVYLQRSQKWRLAGKAATSTDDRWTKRLLSWKPWFRSLPFRNVGHPVKRWEDDLVVLAGGNWPTVAQDSDLWVCLQEAFINGF